MAARQTPPSSRATSARMNGSSTRIRPTPPTMAIATTSRCASARVKRRWQQAGLAGRRRLTVLTLAQSSIYNVITNSLIAEQEGQQILGSVTNTMASPYLTMPAFPTVTAGTTAIDVAKNKTLTLAARQLRFGACRERRDADSHRRPLPDAVPRRGPAGNRHVPRGDRDPHQDRVLDTAAKSQLILDQLSCRTKGVADDHLRRGVSIASASTRATWMTMGTTPGRRACTSARRAWCRRTSTP